MKKYSIHTIISVIVFWGIYSPAVALSSEVDQSFLDLLNEVRRAPYEHAIDMEYYPNSLVAKGILPETNFAPYTLDSNLNDTTAASSTGGVVSFFNFMPRDTACKITIDYLFKNELNTNTFDHILSEEYSSACIDISAGKVGSGNAWFVDIFLL